ncbi:MAG: hypothetical protein ACRDSK_13665 [Actinophytocola sp.]|uniref:hypothetical protein n=1 Tax=Actinophytocola sp. TaxID=1872138 RepID=UPI003D6BE1E9
MPDALFMNVGKAQTATGTATISAATDLATLTAHGFINGDAVMVDAITGGAATVLRTGVVYFVRDSTVNTFGIAPSIGGPKLDFATDGGATVYRAVPAYDALELRRGLSTFMMPGVNRYGTRSGIRPGGSNCVSLSGFGWSTLATPLWIDPQWTATSAPYAVGMPAASGTVNANEAQSRKDILVARIYDDDEAASSRREAVVEYVAGVAGSGNEPAVPPGGLRLCGIDVPATTGNPVLTYNPHRTVAVGGVLPILNSTERPTVGLYEGLYVDRADNNDLERYNGASWQTIGNPDRYSDLVVNRATVKARRSTTQSIPNDVNEPITWNSESFDNDGMISVPSDTITVQTGGFYVVVAACEFAGNTNGYRRLLLVHNGTAFAYQSTAIANTLTIGLNACGGFNCVAGDTIRVWVRQNSGGALNVNADLTHVSVFRVV